MFDEELRDLAALLAADRHSTWGDSTPEQRGAFERETTAVLEGDLENFLPETQAEIISGWEAFYRDALAARACKLRT